MIRIWFAARVVVALLPVLVLLCSQALGQVTERELAIAAGNTATKIGPDTWDWTIFIQGDTATLRKIKCVTYHLHPTFAHPVQRVCTRGTLPGKAFPLQRGGWGTFQVNIEAELQDGTLQFLTYPLTFAHRVEGWSALSMTGQSRVEIPVTAAKVKEGSFVFALTLDAQRNGPVEVTAIDIAVRQDGSGGKTRWRFDILMNDEPWIRLGARSYDDSKGPVRLTATSLDVLPTESNGGDGTNSIRIVGYR
jgi:hypothetical protein